MTGVGAAQRQTQIHVSPKAQKQSFETKFHLQSKAPDTDEGENHPTRPIFRLGNACKKAFFFVETETKQGIQCGTQMMSKNGKKYVSINIHKRLYFLLGWHQAL